MDIAQLHKRFPTQESCLAHIETVRWKGEPVCPYCGALDPTPAPRELRHHCNACNTSFSATVGTVFHRTHVALRKWFLAVSLILEAKEGISARQLGRDLEVNKNTAWRIALQIRRAMASGQRELLESIVEADGSYIRAKPRKARSRAASSAPGAR